METETLTVSMDAALIEGMNDEEWKEYWDAQGRILRSAALARRRLRTYKHRSDGQLGRKNGKHAGEGLKPTPTQTEGKAG